MCIQVFHDVSKQYVRSSNLHGTDVKETDKTLNLFFSITFFFSASNDASHHRNLYENVKYQIKILYNPD